VLLVAVFPDVQRVVLLGIGNTAGLTLAAALLLVGLRRTAGADALAGTARSVVTALVAGGAALAAGLLLPRPDTAGVLADLAAGAALALAAALVYLGTVRVVHPAALRGLTGD
jgi:putative peptidoglycan lipid II flippase